MEGSCVDVNESRPPFSLTVKDPRGQILSFPKIKENLGSIPVNMAGKYELASVSDSVCSGSVVDSHKKFEIVEIQRPSVSIPAREKSREAVCEGSAAFASLEFTGSSPFSFEYQVSSDHGRDIGSMEKIDGDSFRLPLPSTPGTHIMHITRIADSHYSQLFSLPSRLEIVHHVYPKPKAKFIGGPEITFKCGDSPIGSETLSQSSSENQVIDVEFDGTPPFSAGLTRFRVLCF